MRSVSDSTWFTVNTDGSDTWNSRDIYFANWTVEGGDDCIAMKGNSTNVHIKNVTCMHTHGMPIGSVGQDPSHPDYVQNILYEDVRLINSTNGAWFKTWQGESSATSNNGNAGGGGGGFVTNITFRNFEMTNVGMPISITQCVYSTSSKDCDTSKVSFPKGNRLFFALTRYPVPKLRCYMGECTRHVSLRHWLRFALLA